MTHTLKCLPQYFTDIQNGKKTFEVRVNDRGYQVGDMLVLQEWEPETACYTGNELKRVVSYLLPLHVVLTTDQDAVVMGLKIDL